MKKLEKAEMECYQLLYENATPKADFQQLIDQAEINQFSQKIIPYWDYQISQEKYIEIVNFIVKKYKLSKAYSDSFKISIALGVAPKFKL